MLPALAELSQCKDHCIDLVGIGVDAGLSLRGSIPFAVVGTANADEILSEDAPVEGLVPLLEEIDDGEDPGLLGDKGWQVPKIPLVDLD